MAAAAVLAAASVPVRTASADVLRGDLNGDGIISAADAVMLAKLVAEDEALSLTADALNAADVDEDGLVTILDAAAVLRTVSNTSQMFTIEGFTVEDAMIYSIPFGLFKDSLRGALMKSEGGLLHITMPYGETFCGNECTWLFVALNHNYAPEDVYSDFSKAHIDVNSADFKTFIYHFGYVQNITGNDIDFTKYTCDVEIGLFLNKAQQAWRSGSFDDFMQEYYVGQKMSEDCLNNPGVMGILCSYDESHNYLDESDISKRLLNPFINHICESSAGHPYIPTEE